MLELVILFAAIIPAIVLLVWIYRTDKYQREPISQILKGFGYGVLSVLIAGTLELALNLTDLLPDSSTVSGAFCEAFVQAALIEEAVKLFFVWRLIRKNPYFDEHFDGIVYAASVGLGFAAFENIGYLFGNMEGWLSTAVARSIFSTPGHFFFGVVMGYFLALAYFGKDKNRNFLRAFYVPVLLHGTYDFLLMVLKVDGLRLRYMLLIEIIFLVFFIKMWKQGRKRIKMQLELDRETLQQHGSFTAFVEETLTTEQLEERGQTPSAPADAETQTTPAAAEETKPTLKPITYNEKDYMPDNDFTPHFDTEEKQGEL